MTDEDAADQILEQVRGMVESALDSFRFASGNSDTFVLSGYPYSVVGSSPVASSRELVETVNRIMPYWRRTGAAVQFFPFDPQIKVNGELWHSSPTPSLPLSSGLTFYFLEVEYELKLQSKCFGANPDADPPAPGNPSFFLTSSRVKSAEIKPFKEIPAAAKKFYTDPCTGESVESTGLGLASPIYHFPIFVKPDGGREQPFRFLLPTGKYKKNELGEWVSEYEYYATSNEQSWGLWLAGFSDHSTSISLSLGSLSYPSPRGLMSQNALNIQGAWLPSELTSS